MTSIIECDYFDENIRLKILEKCPTYKEIMANAGHYIPFVLDSNLDYVDIKLKLYSKDKVFLCPRVYDEIISIGSKKFNVEFEGENGNIKVENCSQTSFPRLMVCLVSFQKISITHNCDQLDVIVRCYCTEKKQRIHSSEYEDKINDELLKFGVYYHSGIVYKV